MIASVPEQQIAAKENKFDILVIALSWYFLFITKGPEIDKFLFL
jgi:hypothetical protein